ncbi:hypothetical protein KA183_04470 [bacterium]|nr:hypothetical protein [bacterium]QQR59905.1 MAG: hypothetical protein IPG59_10610 [Candidatus Melainabacteria bacterium]
MNSNNTHVIDSLMSIWLGAIVLFVFSISRIGFSLDLTIVGMKCLSYLALLLLLPAFARKIFPTKHRTTFLTSEPNAIIIILLLHLLLLPFKELILTPGFYLIGIPLLLWAFLQIEISNFKKNDFFFFTVIFVVGVILALFLFASPYHNSLLLERVPVQKFISSGSGVIDTYYHSAIVSMISVYGVISTGLSGIPYHAYHSGSHLLFSCLCKILNIDSLSFYQIGYPLIVIPLLLKSILVFVRSYQPTEASKFSEVYNVSSLLILAAGLTYILPEKLGLPLGLWYSAYNSESHSLGLAYFFLLFAALNCIVREHNSAILKFASLIPLIFLLPLLIFTKTSTGAVAVLLIIYAFLRFGGYRNFELTFAFILGLIGAALAYKPVADYVATYEGAFTFIFLGFYKKWFVFPWIFVHFIVIYSWSTAVIILELKRNCIHSLSSLVIALKEKKLISSEVLSILIVFGTIPGIMNIAGSNAMYFLEMQYFLGFVLLAMLLPLCDKRTRNKQKAFMTLNALLVSLLFLNITFSVSTILKEQRSVRSALKYFQTSKHPWERKEVADAQNYIQQLRGVAKSSFSSRVRTAVFISPNLDNYWELFDSWQFLPNTIGFFGPGISGSAFVYGLPHGKVRMDLYGLRDYDFSWVKNGDFPNLKDAKRFAKRNGFEKLLVWKGEKFESENLKKELD